MSKFATMDDLEAAEARFYVNEVISFLSAYADDDANWWIFGKEGYDKKHGFIEAIYLLRASI